MTTCPSPLLESKPSQTRVVGLAAAKGGRWTRINFEYRDGEWIELDVPSDCSFDRFCQEIDQSLPWPDSLEGLDELKQPLTWRYKIFYKSRAGRNALLSSDGTLRTALADNGESLRIYLKPKFFDAAERAATSTIAALFSNFTSPFFVSELLPAPRSSTAEQLRELWDGEEAPPAVDSSVSASSSFSSSSLIAVGRSSNQAEERRRGVNGMITLTDAEMLDIRTSMTTTAAPTRSSLQTGRNGATGSGRNRKKKGRSRRDEFDDGSDEGNSPWAMAPNRRFASAWGDDSTAVTASQTTYSASSMWATDKSDTEEVKDAWDADSDEDPVKPKSSEGKEASTTAASSTTTSTGATNAKAASEGKKKPVVLCKKKKRRARREELKKKEDEERRRRQQQQQETQPDQQPTEPQTSEGADEGATQKKEMTTGEETRSESVETVSRRQQEKTSDDDDKDTLTDTLSDSITPTALLDDELRSLTPTPSHRAASAVDDDGDDDDDEDEEEDCEVADGPAVAASAINIEPLPGLLLVQELCPAEMTDPNTEEDAVELLAHIYEKLKVFFSRQPSSRVQTKQ